jgi:recombinational DNA repair protein (RecF pathway)
MSFSVYHATGLIVSVRNAGESDREYLLLTRELGIVRARARSVRLARSKLRYILHPYRVLRVDFVRGKAGWRLTSAILLEEFVALQQNRVKRTIAVQCLRLAARLLQTDEPSVEVYEEAIEVFRALAAASEELAASYEALFAARILAHLGYWRADGREDLVLHRTIRDVDPRRLSEMRPSLVAAINESLRHSHL